MLISVVSVTDFQPMSTDGSSPSTESLGTNYPNTKRKVESNLMLSLGLPNNGHFLINALKNHCQWSEQDIFICLKKNCWNEPYRVLGLDFNLSPAYIGNVFRITVPKLALCFNKFILWPTKTQFFFFFNQPIPLGHGFLKFL